MSRQHRAIAFCIAFFFVVTGTISVSAIFPRSEVLDDLQTTHAPTIDHSCVNLDSIPQNHINSAKENVRIHYAHTSHGSQITTGLSRLESANISYSQAQGSGTLPTESGALCILDGNPPHSYITPELYWESQDGLDITQDTIDNNPTLSVSLWSWCTQLNYYSSSQVEQYLSAMSSLESANPDITFVYMTGNAQAAGSDGYNRWLNNEIIRDYCRENNKVLFDFADLDCWSDGELNTYEYDNGTVTFQIPLEHPDFNGDQAGHTTYTSCEQKGRAFWWLVACLSGWNSPNITTTTTEPSPTNLPSSELMIDGVGIGVIVLLAVASFGWSRRG